MLQYGASWIRCLNFRISILLFVRHDEFEHDLAVTKYIYRWLAIQQHQDIFL